MRATAFLVVIALVGVAFPAFAECDRIDAYIVTGATDTDYYSQAVGRCYRQGLYSEAFIAIDHEIRGGQDGSGGQLYFNSWDTTSYEAVDTTDWPGGQGACFYTNANIFIANPENYYPVYGDHSLNGCACIPITTGGGGGEDDGGDEDDLPGGGCAPGVPLCSPILFDMDRKGFALTDAANGVRFDIDGDGDLDPVAWTSPGSEDAFLWIDDDGNGRVTDGNELFGNASHPNGFEKLGGYDKPQAGGNGDGRIDGRDAVWTSLRLWIDRNHDARSTPDEITWLAASRFAGVSVEYQRVGRRDRFGNVFRYMGRAFTSAGSNAHEIIYDVYFSRSQ